MDFSKLLISSLSLLLLVSGCNQQSSSVDENAVLTINEPVSSIAENSYQVSGVASKGPIQNSTVEIYTLDNTGLPTGVALATTTTNANGQWQANFSSAPAQATLIVVSGGSYIDEADPAVNKRTITLASYESLKGILFPQTTTASVTILTTALLEKSISETTSNNFQAVLNNNRNTAKLALGFDPFTVAAANPLSPSTSDSLDSIEYAMYLGGVANALNSAAILLGKPVPDYEIMMGMVKDMSDGFLNGQYLGNVFQVSVDGINQNFPANIDLNQSIQRFRNNNFAAYSVTDVQETVSVNEEVLAVLGSNLAPTAVDDSASTISGVSINLNNVLANDIDPDGDQLTVASITQPSNGIVTEISNGIYTFTPSAGFTGNTVFTYTASDNRGGEDTAQVVISVAAAPVIDPPTPPPTTGNPPTADAGLDLTVNEETAVTLTGSGVDSDGNVISDFLWAQVSGTTANLAGTTTSVLSFTSPTITQIDVLVFTLTTTDDDGLIAIDTVSVIVIPVNAAPTADAGTSQTVSELSNVSLTGSGTDSDSNNAISYQWSQISGGTPVTLLGGGTANATFTAPDIPTTEAYVFALTVTDNEGAVAIDTVNILVTALNDIPVADAGVDQTVDEQTAISLTGAATDTDGTISSYAWSLVSDSPSVTLTNTTTNATNDTVSLTTPVVLINSVDVLVLQLLVTDNAGAIHTDYVTVIVNPVLVDPVADAGIDQTLVELLPVTLNGSGTDEGSVINNYSWSQISPVSPVASLNNTTISNPIFTGPDIANDTTFTFELTVTDIEGGTATDTVAINLTSLNTGPTLVDDPSESTPEDTPVVITSLLGNDSDPENDNFSLNSITQPVNGSVVIEANSLDVTYSPNLNFNGTDTFTYTAVDQFGAFSTNTATVTVNVSGVNDDPVAVTDEGVGYSVTQGFPIILSNLTTNDTDPENDGLSITGVTQPGNGKAVNNGDGTVTYTPDLTFNGTDSFTYTIVDGVTGSDTGIINIVVIADTDGDGIIDTDEGPGGTGTDPLLADSDNDGFFDGHELTRGTNPNLITEFPPTTIISLANSNNNITVDTTWTLFNSPYWLQTDVSVQSGATLTIEPGVVIKSNLNVDIIINSGGILNAQGNAALPQHVVFTSALDDQINGDTNGDGVASVESDNDWGGIDYNAGSNGTIRYGAVKNAGHCIGIYNSSPVIDNVEIGDCLYYGIDFQTSSSTRTANFSNLTLIDYDNNGQSTGYSGIRVYGTGATTTILNINDLNLVDAGTSSNYGLYIYANGGSINGTIDYVTVTNPGNDGIHILNSSSGNVDLTLSNFTISGSPNNSLEIRDSNTSTGILATTILGNNSIVNGLANASVRIENNDPDFHLDILNPLDSTFSNLLSIDNGSYGMNLINTAGNFNNISIDNAATAGIKLSSSSNPAEFSNVVLTNAITPYELTGQNITATIAAGYDFSDASVTKSYIRIGGNLIDDMTLTVDPLSTTESVWYVYSAITVPGGKTLTIDDGAIIKFPLNTYLTVNGNLVVGDGNGIGARAVLTSFRDDSVGTAIGDGTAAARLSNSHYISVGEGSSINIDNADIKYARYGIYQWYTSPTALSITNTTFSDIYYHGMEMNGNTGDVGILDLDNVSFDTVGVNTSYHAIYLYINNDATATGTWTDVTINNTGGDGILIDDNSTGIVDPVISGLTIGNTGSIGQFGVDIQGNATTTPTFDNSSGNINQISGGSYNLLLRGVAGDYSSLTLEGGSTAPLYFSSTPPITSWDDNSIIINNATTPYLLTTSLPAIVGILGTSDIGYNQASSSVTEDFVKIAGTIANLTLTADPLGVGSQYYVNSTITVPSGVTLTVNDGAIIKFPLNTYLAVNGNLVVGDGDGAGARAVLTSFRDDSVGTAIGDGTAAARLSNSHYISVGEGSSIIIDNADIKYARYGVYQWYTSPTALSITNTTFSDIYYHGMEMNGNTGDVGILDLDNVSFDSVGVNTSYHAIYLYINNDATSTGIWTDVTINNTGGDGILIDDNSTGIVDPVISGLTIGNTGSIGQYGVDIQGDATTTPTFDNSSGNINQIAGGSYNLLLRGVAGDYSSLTFDGGSTAPLYFSSTPPITSWDDNSIIINNATTPYLLTTSLPAIVGVLGTTDLGYNQASSSVTEDFVKIAGTISNLTLAANPLGAGSQYYVNSTITVPSGVTLTVNDGAILKFPLSAYLFVNGSLVVGDGDGTGARAVFTSFRDDSVGSPIGDGTAAARHSNSHYMSVGEGSSIIIDNADISYASYGIYQWYTSPAALSITNTTFSDIYYHGMVMNGNTGDVGILDLDNVSFDTVGVNTSYHAIYLYINNDATATGTWTDVTINNIGGDGILIDDNSTGIVNPLISGLTIGNTGSIGQYGVDIQGNSNTSLTFDNSSGNDNQILAGKYNLLLRGVVGSYSNLTLDGATIAAAYFSADALPDTWSLVSIDNAPTPYEVNAMGIPVSVSYTPGVTGFSQNYIRFTGTLSSDLTLNSDPLNFSSGTGLATDPTVSYWYSPSNYHVGNTATLTIEADTLVKFAESTNLEVNSGGVLNINGTPGNEVYLTSFSDNVVGDPGTSAALANDWYGIYFKTGSNGGSISNLKSWYAYYGVYFENVATDPIFTNLTIDYALYGLYFTASTAIAPSFNNISINRSTNQGIYFTSTGFIAPTFTGTKSIIGPSTDCIYNVSSSPNILISGWTLDGCTNGLDIRRAGTYIDNLIRNNGSSGIYVNTTSAITIGNNRIVNNGNSTYGGGIDVRGIGTTSVIENNLIRQNRANYGAGMYFDGGTIDATIRNNLIIENHASTNVGGVYIYDNSTLKLINNTISGNTEIGASDIGTGLFIQNLTNNVTFTDNIIADNRDANSLENINDLSTGSIENFNLEDGNSINGLTGANSLSLGDIGYEDPGFTEGWYLGATTGPIDSGSDLPVNLGLTGTTTQTDGTLDGLLAGNSDTVDMGYHYSSGSVVVDADSSIVTPGSATIALSGSVTLTITPKDAGTADVGFGLVVEVAESTGNGTIGSIVDLGDGTYRVTFLATSAPSNNTLTFTVNGVQLTTQPVITWN